MRSLGLLHGFDRSSPLVDLLVLISRVDDLALCLMQDIEQNRSQVLGLVNQQVIDTRVWVGERPELDLSVVTERWSTGSLTHSVPQVAGLGCRLLGEACELSGTKLLEQAISGHVRCRGSCFRALHVLGHGPEEDRREGRPGKLDAAMKGDDLWHAKRFRDSLRSELVRQLAIRISQRPAYPTEGHGVTRGTADVWGEAALCFCCNGTVEGKVETSCRSAVSEENKRRGLPCPGIGIDAEALTAGEEGERVLLFLGGLHETRSV